MLVKYTILTKEFLEKEYNENNKSLHEIARMIGSSHIPVLKAMKKYGLARRSIKEANKDLHKGKKWDKEIIEIRRIGLLKYYKTHSSVSGMLGKNHSEKTKLKMSESASGENNSQYGNKKELSSRWRGGISHPRNTEEYKFWRISVWKRDNFTCIKCGKVGKDLHAHHIKSFSEYTELRFELDNGTTLCKDCHHEAHWGKRV